MKVVLDHTRPEADNITTFFFRPESQLNYTAGQYIQLSLPHPHPDSRGSKRWFTLSSSPTDELLSITTKFASKNSSSFKRTLRTLQPGAELNMSDPMGDFVLPKLIQTPLVFVACGIGVTPFHSIFSWLANVKEPRSIRFLYGVDNEDEIIFQDTFAAADIHSTIVVSHPSAAWGGERGHLNAGLILGLETPDADSLFYLSGPEKVVINLKKQLLAAGINSQKIVTDEFLNYQDI